MSKSEPDDLSQAGVSYARVQAQQLNARNWRALETRYAESANPLAMAL